MIRQSKIASTVILCGAVCTSGPPAHADGGWSPRVTHFSTPQPVIAIAPALDGWDARIEVEASSDTVDAPQAFASGDPSKTVFATVQRRFPDGGVTPYLGLGAGYAGSLVDNPSSVLRKALAFKGVFGTDITLEEGLGAFIEYNFAVAPGALAEDGQRRSLRSHALSTGLRLDLN